MKFQVYTLLLSIDVVNKHAGLDHSYYHIVIDIPFCLTFLVFYYYYILALCEYTNCSCN